MIPLCFASMQDSYLQLTTTTTTATTLLDDEHKHNHDYKDNVLNKLQEEIRFVNSLLSNYINKNQLENSFDNKQNQEDEHEHPKNKNKNENEIKNNVRATLVAALEEGDKQINGNGVTKRSSLCFTSNSILDPNPNSKSRSSLGLSASTLRLFFPLLFSLGILNDDDNLSDENENENENMQLDDDDDDDDNNYYCDGDNFYVNELRMHLLNPYDLYLVDEFHNIITDGEFSTLLERERTHKRKRLAMEHDSINNNDNNTNTELLQLNALTKNDLNVLFNTNTFIHKHHNYNSNYDDNDNNNNNNIDNISNYFETANIQDKIGIMLCEMENVIVYMLYITNNIQKLLHRSVIIQSGDDDDDDDDDDNNNNRYIFMYVCVCMCMYIIMQ